jgi:D-3-phosphoglycerate dehydrogenase
MLGLIDEFRPLFAEKGVTLHAPRVVQTMSEEELIAVLPDFDGWIIGDDPASRAVLEAGVKGRLRAIVKWGVGVDNVDFAAASEFGLKSVNTPGVFGREVADLAMNYVGGLARETFYIDREIRLNDAWPKPSGISLADKVVGLAGFGDIGRNVAKRLVAADMTVKVYDPFYQQAEGLPAFENPSWPDGVEDCDFLVFTAPLNPSTFHMFNSDVLPKVKPGVRLVNVGRGPVVEEAALVAGLESGAIHSVALDVFEVEPLGPSNALRGYPLNIFGSHNASNTRDAVRRVSQLAIERLFGFLEIA